MFLQKDFYFIIYLLLFVCLMVAVIIVAFFMRPKYCRFAFFGQKDLYGRLDLMVVVAFLLDHPS